MDCIYERGMNEVFGLKAYWFCLFGRFGWICMVGGLVFWCFGGFGDDGDDGDGSGGLALGVYTQAFILVHRRFHFCGDVWGQRRRFYITLPQRALLRNPSRLSCCCTET